MDFSLLASDNNLNAAAFSLQNDAGKHKGYGFGFLKQDRAINEEEEELREFKMAKTTSSCREGALSLRSNGCNLFPEGHHQMLSFSSPNSLPLPFYHYPSTAFPRSAGNNGGSMGVRGPFTPSQWMELEHQALIYKYITANVPIPSYLLNPIRKAFDSAGFSAFRSNPLGWSGFQLGFSNSDPEPGRCRRTDGKKWRCSRDAVVDQKYCERHMNRGRHRSRKPVEGQQQTGPSKPTPAPSPSPSTTITRSTPSSLLEAKDERRNSAQEPGRQEFGLVCSDSLLNPLNRGSSLRQFMDEWPKNRPDRSAVSWDGAELQPDRTQLSISIPMDFMSSTSSPTNEKLAAAHSSSPPRELEMGLGVGSLDLDRGQRQSNWVPISWEPSSIGGPLGEVLHKPSNEMKQLNLIEKWDNNNNSSRLTSSPTGVLQRGAFASLSNSSASSPRPESNRIINPSLPTL